jgi:hypothetical protein
VHVRALHGCRRISLILAQNPDEDARLRRSNPGWRSAEMANLADGTDRRDRGGI